MQNTSPPTQPPQAHAVSEEEIVKEFEINYQAQWRWVRERYHKPSAGDWIRSALSQHAAAVRKEVVEECIKVVKSYMGHYDGSEGEYVGHMVDAMRKLTPGEGVKE